MFNVFRNFLGTEPPPTKVQEVKADSYSSRNISTREDGLVLYKPQSGSKEKSSYEIILHKPYSSSAFSIFRSDSEEEATLRFINLKERLPVLVDIAPSIFNTQSLQKLCDTIQENPSWSLAHLAAFFSLSDSFSDPKIKDHLNDSDPMTGISPLQVAIRTANAKTVQSLVNLHCSLNHLDRVENSVFHYAASTTKDIIGALAQENTPSLCLNSRNKDGYTPLHMACLADKPECVKALLLAGADVNLKALNGPESGDVTSSTPGYVGKFLKDNANTLSQQDMKFGGTPLHWACSRAVVDTLVDMNCDIDQVNFEGRTALHVMVVKKRLDCAVALLSRGAKPDIGDVDGNTPLHWAVKMEHLPLLQCLIVFGANLDALNNKGMSPRHMMTRDQEPKLLYYLHAVGAKRCPKGISDCTEGCIFNGNYDGIPPEPVIGPANRETLNHILEVAGMEHASKKNDRKNKGRLLCLDGGGIRGLILIQMLLELEKVIGEPINNCFDWIAGTSTGGILALALSFGKSMRECLCLYFRMKEQTFIGMRPYASEALENILKECFGENTMITDIQHPKILITSVLANRKPVELHLFRNYESPSKILNIKSDDSPFELPPPPEETHVWHVGRATGAAPTYFRAFGYFLDGGLIANNPTLDALTEIHEYNLALRARGREKEVSPVTCVVSLGTGLIPVKQLKDIDVFRPESLWDTTKLVMGISSLGTLLVDQATLSDGRVVDRARAWCSTTGVPYFRFSPQMSEDVGMDEKSDEKLCKMCWEAKAYMHANINNLKEVADILLKT
ncbi:85/88 kDa calcium-independent phospholipase A2 [Agrilus planipennis]|uniref:phospholipase A2 n=1 Tax=Agrilus planipennis TaxID=224129 RepID=A0A1W4WFT9_AGRPL|nr:85/88 kDa calcium-independent phospholipase A2 [Agrilus planipennis]